MFIGRVLGRKVVSSEALTGTLAGDNPASAFCVSGTVMLPGVGMLGGR